MSGRDGYILGYDAAEARRLEIQASVADAATREMLVRAGVGPGMRVLDVGCGMGNVSAVAASLVGRSGAVVGVDRSEAGFARARELCAAQGCDDASFVRAELPDVDVGDDFDVVVGRFVLLYFADPAEVLRRLVRHVRPGGVVAFQEIVWSSGRSVPPVPAVASAYGRICEAYRLSGLQVDMGDGMARAFRAAGVPPTLVGTTFIEPDGKGLVPWWLAGLVRGLMPAIVGHGIATEAEVGPDTLEARIRAEVAAADATIQTPCNVACWGRTPA